MRHARSTILIIFVVTNCITFDARCSAQDRMDANVERIVWQWLDANIGSQERLSAARVGQNLSGVEIGHETKISPAESVLFKEQLNLLYEIRKEKNVPIAKQYMLVHTLMTISEAEHTQTLLAVDDPRRIAVLQQIDTGKQLLAALGYKASELEKSKTGPAVK